MPHVTINDLIDFLVVTVLLRGIISHWIADQILRGLKWLLITSERELILWLHYRDKASGKSKKL